MKQIMVYKDKKEYAHTYYIMYNRKKKYNLLARMKSNLLDNNNNIKK